MEKARKKLEDFKKANATIIELLDRKTLERDYYIKRKNEIDSDPNYKYDGKLIKERNDIILILEQCDVGIANIQSDLKKETDIDKVFSQIHTIVSKEMYEGFDKEFDKIKKIYDDANKQVLEIKNKVKNTAKERNINLQNFRKELLLLSKRTTILETTGIKNILQDEKIETIFKKSTKDTGLADPVSPYL